MKLKKGDLVRDKYVGDRFGIVLKVIKNRVIVRLMNSVKLKLYLEDLEVVDV